MKGDFTRNTFDLSLNFSRVLMQQGRVQLDADWNEQVSILLNFQRLLTRHIMGPHGFPTDEILTPGFGISDLHNEDNFTIGAGRYYVQGILCQTGETTYKDQPGYPFPGSPEITTHFPYLVYLDVWERHVTSVDEESIRELALGGLDTATRAQIVSQVKVKEYTLQGDDPDQLRLDYRHFLNALEPDVRNGSGRLKARARPPSKTTQLDPCILSPEARYRGAENQLYRVEIHRGGRLDDKPTFKWSRENGSVVFPVRKLDGSNAWLESLGRDSRLGLEVGDWVEIVDDETERRLAPGVMAQVDSVNALDQVVTLKAPTNISLPDYDEDEARQRHLALRRWDQRAGKPSEGGLELNEGAALLREGTGEAGWLTLEDGIQIQFQSPGTGEEDNIYFPGDYWMIPARTITGDVIWPGGPEDPQAVPSQGVRHWYAPLAVIAADGTSTNLRRELKQLWQP